MRDNMDAVVLDTSLDDETIPAVGWSLWVQGYGELGEYGRNYIRDYGDELTGLMMRRGWLSPKYLACGFGRG